MDFLELMRSAIAVASSSPADVPVGAVLVNEAGEVLFSASNQKELLNDPTAHAEIVVIRQAAAARGDWRLEDLTLVVTLEPCAMCAGAIAAARIPRVVFGAWDEAVGAAGSRYDLLRDPKIAQTEVIGGVLETECSELLKDFFSSKRALG